MAKSSSNYRILVGVELDVSDIQRQLNAASRNIRLNLDSNIASESRAASEGLDSVSNSANNAGNSVNRSNRSFMEAGLIYSAYYKAIELAIDAIKAMVEQVFELDAALTEFKKVSELSGDSLDDYVSKLSDMGSTVGRTASEMVEAATEFKKSGFSDEDSAQLGQIASMYQNISDEAISAGESANFIIAQLVAFGDSLSYLGTEAEKAQFIIDSVNEVSNRFAVSSSDLSESIGNVSSALAVGGNSFEEVLGLLTAGTEVVRNASKVSRGLVSVQSRYNQIIDESSSTGQALLDWYEKFNIQIFDQQGQLLSLYEVLEQVSEIWPTLTKNEQAYYLNQQAGEMMPLQGEYAGTYLELYIPNYNRNIIVA